MRTFWDQVVALVEQGEPPRGPRQGGAGRRAGEAPTASPRNAALRARCEDIERALDQLERLPGLFQGLLSPVSELALEFDACGARLEEASAKLAALEEAHRSLAARHALVLEERHHLAERCGRLDRENAALRGGARSTNGASSAGDGSGLHARGAS